MSHVYTQIAKGDVDIYIHTCINMLYLSRANPKVDKYIGMETLMFGNFHRCVICPFLRENMEWVSIYLSTYQVFTFVSI